MKCSMLSDWFMPFLLCIGQGSSIGFLLSWSKSNKNRVGFIPFFPLVCRDQNAYGRQGRQSTVILTCNVWHAGALAETIWCFLMQVPCRVWDATQSKLGTASRCDSLLAESCSGLVAMTWAQKPVRHFPGHNFWALHNRIGGGQVWWALTLSTYFPFPPVSLCYGQTRIAVCPSQYCCVYLSWGRLWEW